MSPRYSPADWIREHLNATSESQIGPVCLCYLIPVESCYLASCVFWFISLPAHLLKAVNSQPSLLGWVTLNPEPMSTLKELIDLCTIFIFACYETVIMEKYSGATVDLTSHTLEKSQPDSSECPITSILFVQHCPLKFCSGLSPQDPEGAHVRGCYCITI